MNISLTLQYPGKKESSIYAQTRINGKPVKFYPNKKIETAHWSKSKQEVLTGHKHYKELNEFLKEYKNNLESIIAGMEFKKIRLDKFRIQEELNKIYNPDLSLGSGGFVIPDFLSFIDDFIDNRKGAPSTRALMKVVKTNICLAFKIKKTQQIPFDMIDLNWVKKFENHLYSHKYTTKKNGVQVSLNYKKNYISKQIKNVKALINAAIESKLVQPFSTNSIKIRWEDVDNVFVSFKELSSMLKLDLDGTEKLVRDKFVLNCFLGLRYSDLNSLEPHFFSKLLIDGFQHIIYNGRNIKTDKKVEFAVHPQAVSILKKYQYNIPKLSEGEYNLTIKMIALKAGMTGLIRIRETRGEEKIYQDIPKFKLITSHSGRRSFCTNFFIAGVNIQAIKSISGHKTDQEFFKYINKSATVDVGLVARQVSSILVAAA